MTVKDLRELLSQYPDTMEILETRGSDLGPMSETDWGLIHGKPMVSGRFGWIRKVNEQDIARGGDIRQYLHFNGN